MKFVAKEDIEAPIERVFEAVTDFESFKRSAIRRGAKVSRTDTLSEPGPGMAWDIGFPMRGRWRELKLEMVDWTPPETMRFAGGSGGLTMGCTIELVALSRRKTRLRTEAELKPNTLSARLLIQSLKLARANITRRFETRLADFGRSIEEQQRRRA